GDEGPPRLVGAGRLRRRDGGLPAHRRRAGPVRLPVRAGGQAVNDDTLTLGVLGGMGPAATLEFLARLQGYTPAEKDQDHIHVIADINPRAPDRNLAGSGAG